MPCEASPGKSHLLVGQGCETSCWNHQVQAPTRSDGKRAIFKRERSILKVFFIYKNTGQIYLLEFHMASPFVLEDRLSDQLLKLVIGEDRQL